MTEIALGTDWRGTLAGSECSDWVGWVEEEGWEEDIGEFRLEKEVSVSSYKKMIREILGKVAQWDADSMCGRRKIWKRKGMRNMGDNI